ncbi:MACD2 deacetylase, partial [Locustella ochotensis]|nr:MACD2 deacetylase [Locustella ochotensis]
QVDRIIFCVFLEVDYKIFKKKMGEFFPLDDASEEGAQLSEEKEGQPASPTKSKEEQPEDLQDDAEGGDGAEDKRNTDEIKTESQEAGETKPSAVASLSSEDTELSENKDSLEDTQKGDSVHSVVCEQDQAKGQQDVSANEEIKTGSDSQDSCMEMEDPLLNQEDRTEAEIPLICGADEKEEGKEEERGIQEQEETSVEPMKIDLASQAADVSNKDAEMSSQVESINDPMET